MAVLFTFRQLPTVAAILADKGMQLDELLPEVGLARSLTALTAPLAKVQDLETYEEPRKYSAGYPYVAVNGVLVVDEGKITAAAPGQVLYGPGKR